MSECRQREQLSGSPSLSPYHICPYRLSVFSASGKRLLHRLAPIDDLDRSADAAHVLLVGVDRQDVADGTEQIVDRDGPIFDGFAAIVGRADDLAALSRRRRPAPT